MRRLRAFVYIGKKKKEVVALEVSVEITAAAKQCVELQPGRD